MRIKILAATCALMLLLTGCGSGTLPKQSKVLDRTNDTPLVLSGEDFTSVADNGTLELLLNPATTEVAVREKATGATWYTNPQNRAQDAIANQANASLLSSQIILSYADSLNQITEINNFDLAVKNGQFSFYQTENGLKVDYLLQPKFETVYMPEACTQEDFENKILPLFPRAIDKKTIQESYAKVVMKETLLERRQELTDKYGSAAEEDVIYVLYSSVANLQKKRLSKMFEDAGFTLEEKNAVEERMGVVHAEANKWFTASVSYLLDGDDLVVTVPTEDLKAGEGYLITSVAVLPFFGTASSGEDGYLFVPDGSGAIIDFADAPQFKGPVNVGYYGADNALTLTTQPAQKPSLHLPVFGIKAGNQSFLGILEDGAPLASLQINLAGRINQYYSLRVSYDMYNNAELQVAGISSSNTVRVYQHTPYSGDYAIRYTLLSGADTSYSDMAARYRDYLKDSGQLNPDADVSRYPLYVNFLSAINKTLPVFGIPVDQVVPLTTYDQTAAILTALSEQGVSESVVSLSGWNAGGLRGRVPDAVRPDGVLGGKSGLRRLLSSEAAQNSQIYLNWNGSYYSKQQNSFFDPFIPSFHASKTISQKEASRREYTVHTNASDFETSWWYLYTPEYKQKLASSFLKSMAKTPEIEGIALDWEGFDLNSDFNSSKLYTRAESMENDKAILERFAASGKVMASGVNAYALPYADFIEDMPASSSGLDFYSYDVPFYQMVVHGSVPYAMEKLNLSQYDPQTAVLKLLESGSSPSCLWMAGEDSVLKTSDFSSLYSLNASIWMDQAAGIYKEVQPVLAPLSDLLITKHERVAQNVYRSVYENKTQIYVNYNSFPVTAGGISIAENSYQIVTD